MVTIPPTTLDVTRSIIRLCENADMPAKGYKTIGGTTWTRDELRLAVALNLGLKIQNTVVRVRTVSRRDVALMMAAHGADPFAIEQHALAIAAIIRADFSLGRNGGL
jgi:hypothetical protein